MNPTEEDQERVLDLGLKNIKANAFHMQNSIEQNNLRQCLKNTNALLLELRTKILTPKNYYHLYTAAFDEMMYFSNFLKDEIKRGRQVKDIYESVQQAKFIIPRLYLLITVASLYMEERPKSCRDIIFDLLNMVKGVQNPIRGLFVRYYLLKMIKDKLPDIDNIYLSDGGTFEDTIKFILQNLEEMNRLWIRLSHGVQPNEKLIREKERNELKILVGENITRLSSLNGMSSDLYQNTILPKIISILLEIKDKLSQQYLMECIIHAFPDEYNIICMEKILEAIKQLVPDVDIHSLYITLMEKLSKFVSNSNNENMDMLKNTDTIFNLLKSSFNDLINKDMNNDEIDFLKIFDLEIAFMKFTINCCPIDKKLDNVNYILSSAYTVLKANNNKLFDEDIKKLLNLLSSSLESELSIFDLKDFASLMSYLDFISRKNLGLRIIESLVNGTSKEKLDTEEKVSKLLKFIKPLLEDSNEIEKENENEDLIEFEREQTIVSKLIFVISSKDPEIIFKIYTQLKDVFNYGGDKRKKYTLPTLANSIINLCYRISDAYDYKNNLISENRKTPIFYYNLENIDISKINSDDLFYKCLLDNYKLLNETLTLINSLNSELSFKLYLQAASQVNFINSDKQQFEEACASFINGAMSIFQEGKNENVFNMLINICGSILNYNILSNDTLNQIINSLFNSAQKFNKRVEQCKSMLIISHLFYNLLNDKNKVLDCLKKATRFAKFAMSNPANLFLYVDILNKYIFYIESDNYDDFISVDNIEENIEDIKNHLETIRNENKESDFLNPIEEYFNRTIEIIKKRKEEGKKKIYGEISGI